MAHPSTLNEPTGQFNGNDAQQGGSNNSAFYPATECEVSHGFSNELRKTEACVNNFKALKSPVRLR